MKHKTIALVAAIFFVLPGVSSAQTVGSIQAQITALLAQLQQLQAQLAQAQGRTAWCHTFNINLSIDASGSEVTALQTALQKDGESVSTTGAFDDQTASAVTGFQEKYRSDILTPNGLQNGTGYAGPSTRAKLNLFYGCDNGNTTSLPVPTPVPTSIPVPTPTPVPAPQITSLSKNSGMPGDTITIYGILLGSLDATRNAVELLSNGSMVTTVSGNSIVAMSMERTELAFKLPAVSPGTYELRVSVNGVKSNSVLFIVYPQQNLLPVITAVTYTPGSDGVAELFTVAGQNFLKGSALQFTDTLSGTTGSLTYGYSFSPTEMTFAGNLYTGNVASVYKVKVVDPQGHVSNEMTVNTIPVLPTPQITSAAYNSASGSFTVTGNNFSSGSQLYYTDTVNPTKMGVLKYTASFSPTQTIFIGDLYTANITSVYKIKVVDSQGHVSNKVITSTH